MVVINAATAVRRRYYDRFARHLAEAGLATVTYDYRGVGESRPPRLRGFAASLRQWGELDQAAAIALAMDRFESPSVALVGHSIGGQIVGLLADVTPVRAVLGIAAQHNYWGYWDAPHRHALWVLWHVVMPGAARGLGYFPGRRLGLGEDLPAGIALDWARWCRSPGALVQAVGGDAPARFAAYRGALLALSFADDPFFAPRRAVDALARLYPNAAVERRHIDPAAHGIARLGHFGYFREPARAPLWGEAVDWLARRTAPAAPAAEPRPRG